MPKTFTFDYLVTVQVQLGNDVLEEIKSPGYKKYVNPDMTPEVIAQEIAEEVGLEGYQLNHMIGFADCYPHLTWARISKYQLIEEIESSALEEAVPHDQKDDVHDRPT